MIPSRSLCGLRAPRLVDGLEPLAYLLRLRRFPDSPAPILQLRRAASGGPVPA